MALPPIAQPDAPTLTRRRPRFFVVPLAVILPSKSPAAVPNYQFDRRGPVSRWGRFGYHRRQVVEPSGDTRVAGRGMTRTAPRRDRPGASPQSIATGGKPAHPVAVRQRRDGFLKPGEEASACPKQSR